MSISTNIKRKFIKKYFHIIELLIPSKKIRRGLKNVSYLTIGQFISLIISFFGLIYIARLLGPSDYGIYVTVSAFVGMFVIITFEGINKVVLREGAKDLSKMPGFIEKTTAIKNIFTFSAIIVCIISSFFTPYSIQVKLYIVLFSFSLVYNSFNDFFMNVYKATEKMQYNSIIYILNRVLFVSLSIAFLYMGFGLLTLFIIALFSQFLTLLINFRLTKRFLVFKFWNKIKWDKYIIKPALIFSVLAFAYLLTGKIDLVMISLLGSSKDVGLYGVAHQMMITGLTMRGLLSTAFFPIFVKTYHKNAVKWSNLLKYAIIMGLCFLAIATIISLFSEQIITLMLGEKYLESGTLLGVLAFYLALAFFSFPFSNTLQATHNEIYLLKICWVAPFLNIGLNYLFFKTFGLIGIAYSTLVVGCVSLILYITMTWKALKVQNKLK